ncbi:hypothetical protein RIF29_40841 [Crotalaria pallida]|uniref:Uncharacterized protein n=1 Tax=Crotalaria pallida TaxID=3830 RepID=A0AAN9HQZ3_CROPI
MWDSSITQLAPPSSATKTMDIFTVRSIFHSVAALDKKKAPRHQPPFLFLQLDDPWFASLVVTDESYNFPLWMIYNEQKTLKSQHYIDRGNFVINAVFWLPIPIPTVFWFNFFSVLVVNPIAEVID